MNEGVKIVCDKILENPDITDANSQASHDSRRWMTIANYIIENDYETFSEEEVEMVKNTIREARRKYFTANVLDQVVWETDLNASKDVYSYPLLPRTKKDLERERKEYELKVAAQKKMQEEQDLIMQNFRMKQDMMGQSPYKNSSQYGIANSLLGGHL